MKEENIVVEKLSEKEFDEFNPIIINTIKEICKFSDKHNFDRNSILSYFANTVKAFSEIATIENFEVWYEVQLE